MTRLRKLIAPDGRILQVSAQLTTVVEVDLTKVARIRDRSKNDFQAREGVKLSFLPVLGARRDRALKATPMVNASIEGDEVVHHGTENLSIAVDTDKASSSRCQERGDLNIAGLARAIADVATGRGTTRSRPTTWPVARSRSPTPAAGVRSSTHRSSTSRRSPSSAPVPSSSGPWS
jgi:2-oxoglutarate dehydrogenase E2 component (dihydrolipoamide succinyltransferase)